MAKLLLKKYFLCEHSYVRTCVWCLYVMVSVTKGSNYWRSLATRDCLASLAKSIKIRARYRYGPSNVFRGHLIEVITSLYITTRGWPGLLFQIILCCAKRITFVYFCAKCEFYFRCRLIRMQHCFVCHEKVDNIMTLESNFYGDEGILIPFIE